MIWESINKNYLSFCMKHLVDEPSKKQLGNRKPASLTDFVNTLSSHTACYFIDIPSLQKADFTATILSYP